MRRLACVVVAGSMATVMVLVAGTVAGAATLHVNCDQGGNLQTRINQAPPQSTILIKGTCHGNFSVPKSLTLAGDPAATLDGGTNGSVLTITTNAPVHLAGLTITNGQSINGGGIDKTGTGSLSLDATIVKANGAGSLNGEAEGGGIYSEGGDIRITGSRITNNKALSFVGPVMGGGAYLASGSVQITRSRITGNLAEVDAEGTTNSIGGGLFVTAPATITGSLLAGNRVVASSENGVGAIGGGMDVGVLTMTSSIVRDNTIDASAPFALAYGAGISSSVTTLRHVTLSGNTLSANTTATFGANGYGGGMAAQGTTTVADSTITGNTVTLSGPANIQADGAGLDTEDLVLLRSTLSDNSLLAQALADDGIAGARGGGLLAIGHVRAGLTVFSGNEAVAAGGGSTSVSGGALAVFNGLSLARSTLSGNEARTTSSHNDARELSS